MNTKIQYSRSSLILLRLLTLLLVITGIYGVAQLQKTATLYDELNKNIAAAPVIAKETTLGNKEITIPTYDLFKKGNVWALVSKKKPLSGDAGYQLIDIPVAHGDAYTKMLIADDISDELQQLVNAAEADGEELMVSSAFRSLVEQQRTYDEFISKNGKALASLYVSPVGASEHHTGLSVDFSSVSDDCADDSNTCSLSQSGAAWLAKNAHKYGFIQRYPAGEESITGVAYEPWHFRFIGRPLAVAMYDTDMTYEEVVRQLAPGYATSN